MCGKMCEDAWKQEPRGQSQRHERASEQLRRSIYAGDMKLVFARINRHQKPHAPACDGIVNADGSISHVWIEKQTRTHTHWWSQIREPSSPARALNRQDKTHPWRGQSAKKLKYNSDRFLSDHQSLYKTFTNNSAGENSWVQRCDPSSERRKTGMFNYPVLMSHSLMITFPLASCASN